MIISYAQALEDVVLHRALGGVGEGFYIDVGANDPVMHSVTKLFYERGWRGINVEPSPAWFDRIAADRPRDVNLKMALSDSVGSVTFHDIEGSGLSTLVPAIATRHGSLGIPTKTYSVATDTLAAVCDRHAPPVIHFLKIDVEGAEEKGLRGANFRKHRPWIVLVEATEPLSDAPTHKSWDHLLTGAGYDFVLFDGLNRFYVAQEKSALKPFFVVRGDQYETAAAYWTSGHWRLVAEERQVEIARLNAELAALKAIVGERAS